MPFSQLGLSEPLTTPLVRKGYTQPTPVQLASIPVILTGRDLMARAQTGTGKTAAFGLPMIERLLVTNPRPRQPRRPRGLVLVPTRELAGQVHESLNAYGSGLKLRSFVVFGGVSARPQIQGMLGGVDILIATPGRLLDLMQQRAVELSDIEVLVLDEADRMMDLGFMPALRRIVAAVPKRRQTLLFSATFPEELKRTAAGFMHDPARVDISAGDRVISTVTHEACRVAEGTKGQVLAQVLGAETGQALVFCKTKRGSNRVGEALERGGVSAAVIHGNKSQNARTKALADFKAQRVSVLVATDIAARGLDIPQLPLVVNYDLPLVAADYVHRVGRTGRAGHAGRALSLVAPSDQPLLRDIERMLAQPLVFTTVTVTAAPRTVRPIHTVPAHHGSSGSPTPAMHARPRRREGAAPGRRAPGRPGAQRFGSRDRTGGGRARRPE